MARFLFVCFSALILHFGMQGAVAAQKGTDAQGTPEFTKKTEKDPRSGDTSYERASRLLGAIDSILEQAAKQRFDSRNLPSRDEYLVAVPPWAETKEDRQGKIRKLLDSALEIVTDAPIVAMQKQIADRRKTINDLKDAIADLREKRLDAPKDTMLPNLFTNTVESIDDKIEELQRRIDANKVAIAETKKAIHNAFTESQIEMSEAQLDLLLDSVLGGDLIKLVAAFEAAKLIDNRLGVLMGENSESTTAARRYFAMHAALFAMLLQAQDELLDRIDNVYLTRLYAILRDIHRARSETKKLLRVRNRADQRRALLANREAQDFAEKVAEFYRDYLLTQRKQILSARQRTLKDLRIADNTYETVEASFQLRLLIEDARASFEAIQRLEAPGFDQIFQNKELRKEFENLTRKLVPTS